MRESRSEKEEGKQNSRGKIRAEAVREWEAEKYKSRGSRKLLELGEQNNRGVEEQTSRGGEEGGTDNQMRNRSRPVEK